MSEDQAEGSLRPPWVSFLCHMAMDHMIQPILHRRWDCLFSSMLDLNRGNSLRRVDTQQRREAIHSVSFGVLAQVPIVIFYHPRVPVPKLLGYEIEAHAGIDPG